MKNASKVMQQTLVGLFFLTLVFFTTSCSKTTTAPNSFSSNFPQTIGDSWVYSIRDSIRNFHDTALVTIAGTKTITGGLNAYVWTYHYHSFGYFDTTYVVVGSNNVTVYINTSKNGASPVYVVYEQFNLPLAVGQTIEANGDTSSVIAEGNQNLVAGSFPNTFELTNNTSNFGYHVYDKLTVFYNIGIMSDFHNSSVYGNFLENGNWYLLSYSIK